MKTLLHIYYQFSVDIQKTSIENSNYVVFFSISGFFNTIGRFVGGPLTMIPHFSALRVHNILLYLAGVLTILAAYTYNFATCAIYAGLCGFAIGRKISFNRNSSLSSLF
jgi:hypothetical protein